MKIEQPQNYREKYAAEAGAVILVPQGGMPGWEVILEPGEELLWQADPRPKLRFEKDWLWNLLGGGTFIALGLMMIFMAKPWGIRLLGVAALALGLPMAMPDAIRTYLRQRRCFYSLSTRRAFRGEVSTFGKRRLISWPITSETSFRLIKGDPPSVRFYEGRHESGRRRRYHESFEAIPDAPDVYKLLTRIQKDAA